MLNEKLQFVLEHKDEVQVQITYFVPDERKEGGRYETVLGYVEKIDRFNKKIRIRSGENISVCDIIPSLTLEQSKSGFNPFKYKGLSHFCYENDMYYFFILMFLKVL